MEFYTGPILAPHMGLGWDLQHGSMWYPHGQTHMGPILDLAHVAHVQPTFVEYISDLMLHIFVLLNISTASTKL